jgi:superfamily I DNA/RNA helicase
MIDVEKWQPADGLILEPNAYAAAKELEQNLALTAGPGAGKTEMLAQRADFLLRTGTCFYPQRILAISFKVDASKNLKDRVRKRCGYELASRLDSNTFHGFAKRIIDRFRPVLAGQDALDPDFSIGTVRYQHSQITFEDMVPLAVQILKSSDIARNAIRQTYSHVFLDEFQDCTSMQYQLIRMAFRGTKIQLTAVGDTKQRIMGWAGALEGIFSKFAAEFGAQPLNLYQNFRSGLRIRRVQNAMVKVLDPTAAVPDKQLFGGKGEVTVFAYKNSEEEAKQLAAKIDTCILVDGISPSEIAVLVSKQPDSYAEQIMTELAKRGIPFRNEQKLQDLSTEPAARLIVDLLAVVFADSAPDAYGNLTQVLLAFDTDDDAAHEARSRWNRFIDELRAKVRKLPASKITPKTLKQTATTFLDQLGVEAIAALSPDYESGSRLQEVTNQTFERIEELLAITPDPAEALARFAEDGAVRIMTIHKSKGLEFHTVAVLGVEAQTFWGKREDERAAYFVAISRAKQRLWITHVSDRTRPGCHKGRWDEPRTPHKEFLGYAAVP